MRLSTRKIHLNLNSNVILLLVFMLLTGVLSAQDKKDKIKRNQQKIKQEIAYTTKLLNETRKVKKTSLNQLQLIRCLFQKIEI